MNSKNGISEHFFFDYINFTMNVDVALIFFTNLLNNKIKIKAKFKTKLTVL